MVNTLNILFCISLVVHNYKISYLYSYTGEIVVAPLGAVIVLLCLALVGTLSALLIIISRYKKGIILL